MKDRAKTQAEAQLTQVDFLALPQWRCVGVRVTDHRYEVEAQPLAKPTGCPHCGSAGQSLRPSRQQRRSVLDAPVHGKHLIVHFSQTRYRCLACGQTSGQPLPGLDKRWRATTRLVELIGVEAFRKNFSLLAAETGACASRVRDIFVARMAALELSAPPEAPRQLGLDEVYVQGRARLVLTDLSARRPLDLLPGANLLTLCERLLALKCRGQVELVVMEPHRQLFEAVRRILPQATIIVNKWTVLRLADRALLAVLRQTCAAENNAQRRQLMGCARLLRRGYAHLSEREAEALRMLLKQHSDLRVAYDLKRNFYGLWVCKSRAEAEARYACWERRVPPQLCTSFGQLIRFMGWWQQEVFSYFDHRLTNAFTEAMGAKLRTLQSVTPGQSFATLRAKFLYTTPVRRLTRARRSHKRGADA